MPVLYTEPSKLEIARDTGSMWKYGALSVRDSIDKNRVVSLLSILSGTALSLWAEVFIGWTLSVILVSLVLVKLANAPVEQRNSARRERDKLRLQLDPQGPYTQARWLFDRYLNEGRKLRRRIKSGSHSKRRTAVSAVARWDSSFRFDFGVMERRRYPTDDLAFPEPFSGQHAASISSATAWLEERLEKMEMMLQAGQ